VPERQPVASGVCLFKPENKSCIEYQLHVGHQLCVGHQLSVEQEPMFFKMLIPQIFLLWMLLLQSCFSRWQFLRPGIYVSPSGA
jgi:hypothetical protein